MCINPVPWPKLGTVGLPVPSIEVSIRDDRSAAARWGEIGVRGPPLMQRYGS